MPKLSLHWTTPARQKFDALCERIRPTPSWAIFIQVHNKIVLTLSEGHHAIEKGEPLYHSKRPGGMVRHWMHEFVSVTFMIFPTDGICWIIDYAVVPSTWPNYDSALPSNGSY